MPEQFSLRTFLLAVAVILLAFGPWQAAAWAHESVTEVYDGRQVIVHIPDQLPPMGSRALVVVLHGGLGNAERIANRQSESALNMDAVADRNGFIVAYLNGTPVTRFLGNRFLGWNGGGGCCGQPAVNDVDDVSYIEGAVDDLERRHGIDPTRVFGIGHSNGAMMTQRLACTTHLYAAAVAISGPLNLDIAACLPARASRILAIHGAKDENVPVSGGAGRKGLSRVAYNSEERSREMFASSGATYTLQIVPDADHSLDHIGGAIVRAEGVTIAEKAAIFFGIVKPGG